MNKGVDEQFDPRIDLAVQRTELAEDRTLLAWVRTSLGLMTAGVAFDKGVRFFHEARLASGTALTRSGHFVGISFTTASTLLLLIVVWNYLRSSAPGVGGSIVAGNLHRGTGPLKTQEAGLDSYGRFHLGATVPV